MNRSGQVLVCAVLIGWASIGSAQAPPPRQTAVFTVPAGVTLPTTLPLTLWNGVPVVDGSVKGSQERFVLDTALDANALLPSAQERFQLIPSERPVRVHILDAHRDVPEVELPALTLGAARLQKIPATLLDVFGVLSPRPHPDAPLGWLGVPFLSAFQVTFDLTNRIVLFNTLVAPLPKVKGQKTAPLVLREGRPWVRVNIPGAPPFEALVNTGSPGTLLPTEIVQKLKLQPKPTGTIVREDGQAQVGMVVIPKLNVGGAEVKQMRVLTLLPGAPTPFDPQLAVLGNDFLQRFKVTLNYSTKQIAFAPVIRITEVTPEPEQPDAPDPTP